MSKNVTFCFDFGSPYSYLAYNNLKVIKDEGAEIEIMPVLLGGIFKATGNQPPASVQKKGEYMFKDITRWTKTLNIPFKMNPYFPILTVPHMRGAVLAQKNDILENYMQNLLQRDLGSSLLSVAVILGWLGLFFVFLRILTISIKRILEVLFKKS